MHEWKGSPLQGRLQVYRFATGVEAVIGPALAFARASPLFELDLTEDPAVLAPTAANHVLAEAALTILAAMLPNGADWHKATQAALFPKPAGGSDNLTVVGERDWVLFARRRLDTCAEEVVTPPAPDRRYHVYLREARSEEDAKKWLELVLSSEGSPLEGAQFVGLVDFDGETDEPLDPSALRSALLPVKGQSLAFVLVASEYGGGVAEEGRRRAHVQGVVGDVVDVTDTVPIDRGALPSKFQGRIDGGETVHGVVVLVTLQQVAVANAYGLNTEFALRSVLARNAAGAITVRDPAELGEVQPRSRLLLGPVTFRSGVPDAAQLAAVVEKWKTLRIALGHVVSVTAKAEHDAAAAAERDAIAAATGPLQPPQAWSTHATAGFDTAPEGLNAMVFLVGEPVILLRGIVALVKPDGVRTVKPLLDEGKIHEVLDSAALSRFVELVPAAEFDPETGAVRNPEEVRRAWRGVIGDTPPAAVMTFARGDEDASLTKVIRAQAKSAGAAAGGEPRVSLLRVTDAREVAEGRPREVFHFLLPRQG
jgi:hypothetical protein